MPSRIFIVFFFVALALVGGLYVFLGWRLITPLRLSRPLAVAVWVLLLGHLALIPLGFTLGRTGGGTWWGDGIQWASHLGMGLFSLLLAGVVLRDGGLLALRGLDALAAVVGTGAAPAWPRVLPLDPENLRRLLVYSNLIIVALSLALAGVGWHQARRPPPVVQVRVPIAGLPAALHGFRIAQISDIHLGPTLKGPWLQAVVAQVNALEPDLVVLTGDLVDGTVAVLGADAAVLSELRSPEGTFFVTGNHEYYSGADDWVHHLRHLGLVVLMNEHRIIERGGARLLVAGIPDLRAASILPEHKPDAQRALQGAPPVDVKILLAHQPRAAAQAAGLGFHLMLAGHTHGGQFFPWTFLVPLAEPLSAGLYRQPDGLQVYVNRGTGYWGPPLRLLSPSEITVLELVPEP